MAFVIECLYLLDSLIFALFDIPVFAVFLGGAVVLVCLGVFLRLKSSFRGGRI